MGVPPAWHMRGPDSHNHWQGRHHPAFDTPCRVPNACSYKEIASEKRCWRKIALANNVFASLRSRMTSLGSSFERATACRHLCSASVYFSALTSSRHSFSIGKNLFRTSLSFSDIPPGKSSSTSVATADGLPFSANGLYFHCFTASMAAGANNRMTANNGDRRNVARRGNDDVQLDLATDPRRFRQRRYHWFHSMGNVGVRIHCRESFPGLRLCRAVNDQSEHCCTYQSNHAGMVPNTPVVSK